MICWTCRHVIVEKEAEVHRDPYLSGSHTTTLDITCPHCGACYERVVRQTYEPEKVPASAMLPVPRRS